MLKTILTGVFAATLVSGVMPPARAASPASIASVYGHPQRLVAVNGKWRLNLVCIGQGKVPVVFLSGLGSGAIDWRRVQPAIGKITKACSYDRAGYGFSDPANTPSDVSNAVSDLHALLRAAKFTRPVVLVGHSLGGLYATLYAETYPKDVSGLVLAEPAFSGQSKAIADAVGPVAASQIAAAQLKTLAAVDQCVALATNGRLSLPEEASSDCLNNPPDPEPDVHAERNRLDKSPAYERALRDEFEKANVADPNEMTADDLESARPGASLGARPLVVLTRGNVNELPGLSAEQSNRSESAWRRGHDHLAALSSNGINIIVPHTGHFIQLEQPSVVITYIKNMVSKVSD